MMDSQVSCWLVLTPSTRLRQYRRSLLVCSLVLGYVLRGELQARGLQGAWVILKRAFSTGTAHRFIFTGDPFSFEPTPPTLSLFIAYYLCLYYVSLNTRGSASSETNFPIVFIFHIVVFFITQQCKLKDLERGKKLFSYSLYIFCVFCGIFCVKNNFE